MNDLLTRQETFKGINDNLGDSGAFFDRLLLDGVPHFVADSNCAKGSGHLSTHQTKTEDVQFFDLIHRTFFGHGIFNDETIKPTRNHFSIDVLAVSDSVRIPTVLMFPINHRATLCHLSNILFTIPTRCANCIVKINASIISAKKCFVSFGHKLIILVANVAFWNTKQTIQTTPNCKHFIITFKATILDCKISNFLRRLGVGVNLNKFACKCNCKLRGDFSCHFSAFRPAPELVSVYTAYHSVYTSANRGGSVA